MAGVDIGGAQLDKVADLGRAAQANQVGEDRPHRGPLVAVGRRGRQSGIVCARGEQRQGVFIGEEIPLHAVEQRFGKGHRRQRGPQLLAHGQRHVVLALRRR